MLSVTRKQSIKTKATASGMYAILRHKAARNAWYWRVDFRRRGKGYAKTFHDLKHGGEAQALAAAIAWRDRALAKTKVFTFREFHAQRRSNNTSGAVGVVLIKSAAQPLGAWQALIMLPTGKRISKSFSIAKFGKRKAFRLAKQARAHMLTLIGEQPYLKHETAKRAVARQSQGQATRREDA